MEHLALCWTYPIGTQMDTCPHVCLSDTLFWIFLDRSALHSALSLSSRNITGIRRSDRYARPGSCIDTDLGDTIRVLVEHTEVDMNAESADGNTCFDLAVRKTDARPFARWLLQKAPLDFDVDHRNTRGKTLLMQQASCTTDIVSIKDLLALGADLDARVLDMPEAYCRDIGATALHFAGMHYRTSPQGRFFEKAKYLLCQGADPHVMSSCGHTVTDWVLVYHHYTIFLHWRRILLELGFDLKAFVRKEIDVHADIPWYASNNVDEYVLAHFGFSPRFDESTGAIEFLTLSEEKALEEVQSEHDSDSGSEEIVLFDDSDTEHEQCLSSNSDYQSAAEDMPLTTSQKLLENAQRRTLAGLSRFTSGSSDTRRSAHLWRPYKIMLESDDPEGWTGQKWTDG